MITVKLFGMTKSLADNQSSLTLALGKNQSVKSVIELVNKRYPKIGELISKKKILVSVNQEIAHEDTKLQEGDEVALLPPFAGGCAAVSVKRLEQVMGDESGERLSLMSLISSLITDHRSLQLRETKHEIRFTRAKEADEFR
jgi:molybdopterin converting factor small subunit